MNIPYIPSEIVPWAEYRTGQVALLVPDAGAMREPSGTDRPEIPMLTGQLSSDNSGELVLEGKNVLIVRGRGFDGRNSRRILLFLDGDSQPAAEVDSLDAGGGFLTRIEVPDELGYGEHILEVRYSDDAASKAIATLRFRKAHRDKHLGSEGPASQFDQREPVGGESKGTVRVSRRLR